jgi:transposase
MAYNEDFRLRVMAYLDAGHTQWETCAVFKISWGTAYRWRQIYKETGSVKNAPPVYKPRTGPKKLCLDEFKKYAEDNPKATYEAMSKRFDCSKATVYRWLKYLGNISKNVDN